MAYSGTQTPFPPAARPPDTVVRIPVAPPPARVPGGVGPLAVGFEAGGGGPATTAA